MKKHKLLLSVGVLSSTILPISLTSCHKQEVNEIKKNTQTTEQDKDINTVAANVKVKFIGEASKTHASDVKENQIEFTDIEDGYQKTDVSLRPDDKKGILSVEFAIQKGEEKSNLITKEFTGFLIKTDEAITTPQGGEQGNPSEQTQPENGAQPGNNSENPEILPNDQADNGNTNTSEKDKYLTPELYEPSVKGALFVVNEEHKSDIPALLDKVISEKKGIILIEDGNLIIDKGKNKSKQYLTIAKNINDWNKVNTNDNKSKGWKTNIGYANTRKKGILVEKSGDKYTLKWTLYINEGGKAKKGTDVFSQTLDLTLKSTSSSSENGRITDPTNSTGDNNAITPKQEDPKANSDSQPDESVTVEKQNESDTPKKQNESEKPQSNAVTPPATSNSETDKQSSHPQKDSNKENTDSNTSETEPKVEKEKDKKAKPKKSTKKKAGNKRRKNKGKPKATKHKATDESTDNKEVDTLE